MSITVTETYTKVKTKHKKKVTWKDGTIDNEHLNRKSSKICCIFHGAGNKHSCKDKNKYER